jgi:hypothetical protein
MTALVLLWALATTPVQALGQAQIVAGNRAAARDRALEEAIKQAVDQAFAYVLEPEPRLRAQAQLQRSLLPRARRYVASYRVLDEHEVQGGLFQVQIEAQVDTTALRRDALSVAGAAGPGSGPGTGPGAGPGPGGGPGPAQRPAGRPRVLVGVGAPLDAAVRHVLEARGFLEATTPAGEPPHSDSDAAARAKSAGAGIVIVGAGKVQPEGAVRGTDLQAALARTELRALDADGRALARGAADARGFEPTAAAAGEHALAEAAEQAAAALLGDLAGQLSGPATTGQSEGGVALRVVGLETMARLEALAQALGQQPGVVAVLPRRLGGGEAWFLLRGRTSGSQVAQAVRAQGLEVDAASDREVRARAGRGAE